MPLYSYTAIASDGRKTNGTVEAEKKGDVISRLAAENVFAVSVVSATEAGGGAVSSKRKKSLANVLFPGVNNSDVTALTRQMATFLEGGFPLIRALEFIEAHTGKESVRELVSSIADSVRGGGMLADALAEHPKIFDKLYLSMISAGERSGQLETMFERLAVMRESSDELRGEIKGALTYPAFMMLAMGGSLVILMAFVVPKFAAMFADMGTALPTPTLVLMSVADVFQNFWWLIMGGLVLGYIGFVQYGKTEVGRERIDQAKLMLPILGDLSLKTSTARFSQTLATLLESGVDLVTALRCVQGVTGNEIMGNAIADSIEDVTEGKKLSDTMGAVFPDELVEMVRVGEESGQVGGMLQRASVTYEKDVRNAVKSFTKILEPLMILVMGVVIGLIVIAMLLPVFEMSTGG